MPALTDLNNEQRKLYDPIVLLIRGRKGYCAPTDETFLIRLFLKYGPEKTYFVIENAMLNDWLKPYRWEALMELVEKFGQDRVLEAVKVLNKLENFSIATVEGILKGTIAIERVEKGKPAKFLKKPPMYPTKDFLFNAAIAQKWLNDHKGIGFEHWPDYFDPMPEPGPDGAKVVQLKPEYR